MGRKRIIREKLGIFLQALRDSKGDTRYAVRVVSPNVKNDQVADMYVTRYLNYIDPYRLIFPKQNPTKNIKLYMQQENKFDPDQTRLTKAEISQRAFEGLFEKYGSNGMSSAIKAAAELYPQLKSRRAIQGKARNHLVKSSYTLDLISVLESKGVDSQAVADKIKELLHAKKKITSISRDGETRVLEEVDSGAIDKGLTHALKVGVGGGYAPERSLIGAGSFSLGKLLDQLDNKKLVEAPKEDGN